MGLIVLATAHYLINRNKNQRTHTSSRTESKKRGSDYSDYASKQSEITLNSSVIKEISNGNDKLSDFFNMLKSEYLSDLTSEHKKYVQEYAEQFSKTLNITPNFDKFVEAMNKKGINVSHNISYYNFGYVPFIIENVGSIQADTSDRTKFMKSFYDRLETLKNNMNYHKKIMEEYSEEITIKEKKVKFTIVNRREKKEEIERLKTILKSETEKYNCYLEQANTLESFLNMSEEEKQLLNSSIDELKELSNIRKKLGELRDKIQKTSADSIRMFGIDSDRMNKTITRLYNEGKITENTMSQILLMLDKIDVEKSQGKYIDSQDYSYDSSRSLREVINWFIDKIYQSSKNNIEEEKPKKLIL
jgi:hypothetical protein